MKKNTPKLSDAIRTLEQVNNEIDILKNTVDSFLCDYENITLIPHIIKAAGKAKKSTLTPSWIARTFQKGYSRSFRIVDTMLEAGVIKPEKSRTKNSFRIVK